MMDNTISDSLNTINELIEFNKLIECNKLNKKLYEGVLIFMDDENFSHYQLVKMTNYKELPNCWELDILDEISTLDEIFKLLEIELYNFSENSISENSILENSISEKIQKKIDEDGIYSSYKVKYDYDFNTFIYNNCTNLTNQDWQNHDLYFLIHIFKTYISV